MVDRNTKREVERLWRGRILSSIGCLAALALGVTSVQVMRTYQPTDSQWVLDLSRSADIVKDCDRSVSERQQALNRIKRIATQKNLILVGLSGVLENLSSLLDLNSRDCSTIMVRSQELAQSRELAQELAQSRELAQILWFELCLTFDLIQHNQALKSGEELATALSEYSERSQKFTQAAILLGLSATFGLLLLWFLYRRRYASPLPLTGQLICFLPEECIAELEALQQRLIKQQRSKGVIRLIMIANFLDLLKAFYIEIWFDNLSLPPKNSTKRIDDE